MSRQAADEAFRFRQGLSVPPQKNLFCCYCFQYNLNMLFAGGANPRSKGTRQGQRILSPWKITSRIFNGNFWELCIPLAFVGGNFFCHTIVVGRRQARHGGVSGNHWEPFWRENPGTALSFFLLMITTRWHPRRANFLCCFRLLQGLWREPNAAAWRWA